MNLGRQVWPPNYQKSERPLVSVKFSARNSRAEHGCANYGHLGIFILSAGKLLIKFLALGGGGFGAGVGCWFMFMGICLIKLFPTQKTWVGNLFRADCWAFWPPSPLLWFSRPPRPLPITLIATFSSGGFSCSPFGCSLPVSALPPTLHVPTHWLTSRKKTEYATTTEKLPGWWSAQKP